MAQSIHLVRIGDRVALHVHRPVIGYEAAGALRVKNLSPSLHGHRHVKVDETLVCRRRTKSDGIGTVEGLRATIRDHRRIGLAHGETAQVTLRSHLGIVAKGARVRHTAHAHDADTILLRKPHGLLESQDRKRVSTAVVTVHDAGAGAGLLPRPLGIHIDTALVNAFGVVFDTYLTMAVQAPFGRPGKDLRSLVGMILVKASCHQLPLHEFLEFLAPHQHGNRLSDI